MARPGNPTDTVLNAYADAYPNPGNLKVTIDSNTAKYYPAYTYDDKSINDDFVRNSGKETEINQLQMEDHVCGEKTVAFIPQEGQGSWGYFEAKDVNPYVTFSADNIIIIDFEQIKKINNKVLREIVFHRALTMIYGQQDSASNNYFFDPKDHIEKAAGLKGTVDIMIQKRVEAA